MRIIHLAAALVVLAGSAAARAGVESPSHFKLALSFGSLGIGPEVTYRPERHFGVRASASLFRISHSEDIDGIRYRGKLKLGNYGAMADVYPIGGGFRISGGARYAENRLRLRAMPSTSVTVGNTIYTPAQIGTLDGDITTRKFEPLVTMGYGGTVTKGLSLGIDAGVMFQGTPKISPLTSSTGFVSSVDLANERAQIQDDIHGYKYYPVLQASLGYRF
jgi:hypothetical protein